MKKLAPNKGSISKGALFHEGLAKNWSVGYETGGPKRRLVLFRSLLSQLVCSGDHWLDAGCGSGILAREISLLGGNVTAVDSSSQMIHCAKRQDRQIGGQISYTLVATIESLDIPDLTFDGVLCSSVIEYVDDPAQVISEFFHVTRPGGRLLISVPNKFSIVRLTQKLIRLACDLFGKTSFQYLSVSKYHFSFSEIRRFVEMSGFIVDRIEVFDPLVPNCLGRLGLGSLFVVSGRKPFQDIA